MNIIKNITQIFKRGAASSLRMAYATWLNDIPIVDIGNPTQAIEEGYNKSDIVYSIVSKKAQAGSRAPFGVYKVKSNKAFTTYKTYQEQKNINLKKLVSLKESAIEPINNSLNDKYAYPNDDTSATAYTEMLLTHLNVTGNAFEQAIRKNKKGEVLQFHVMPADLVRIKTDGKYPITSTGYELWAWDNLNFDKREVIHTKYPNPSWEQSGAHLYGLSPLRTVWNLINADEESFNAVWEVMKNRGARKLVGIQSDKITSYAEGREMMEKMKEEFSKRNKEFKDRIQPIFADINVQDIGLGDGDLNILDRAQLTFERLCNVFKVPVEWFNTDKQSKYDNLEQFNKQAILNGVLPDLNRLRDSRNLWAKSTGVLKDNELIDYDVSVFSELEIDKKVMAEWLEKSYFTPNEGRIFQGENPINNPNMDEVYINRNKVSINKVNDLKDVQQGQNTWQENIGQENSGEVGSG